MPRDQGDRAVCRWRSCGLGIASSGLIGHFLLYPGVDDGDLCIKGTMCTCLCPPWVALQLCQRGGVEQQGWTLACLPPAAPWALPRAAEVVQ